MASRIVSAGFAFSGKCTPRCSAKHSFADIVGPEYTKVPPVASNTKSSNSSSVSYRGWWMTHSTVVPRRSAEVFMQSTTSCAVVLSRPLVGSSANSSNGCETSSMAMDTRLRWPPEMPRCSGVPTRASWIALRWRSSSTLVMIACNSSSLVVAAKRSFAWNMTFSSTVSSPWRISSCGTKPVTWHRNLGSWATCPPIFIVPVTLP
mmetsp:Transcript_95830/g.310585  ORF Transcript_95830/g.310585 Transcript_95830/m.310585 type:complete len:205 (+) Transcript_95830:1069-1683(+)